MTAKGARLQLLGEDGQVYDTALNPHALPSIEPNMLFVGSLLKETDWQLTGLKRVFPPETAPFFQVPVQ